MPMPARTWAQHAVDALPLESDGARTRTQQARDRIHQRRLAGAVRPEDGDDLAGGHVEPGLPEHLELTVRDVERLDGKLWVHET